MLSILTAFWCSHPKAFCAAILTSFLCNLVMQPNTSVTVTVQNMLQAGVSLHTQCHHGKDMLYTGCQLTYIQLPFGQCNLAAK